MQPSSIYKDEMKSLYVRDTGANLLGGVLGIFTLRQLTLELNIFSL